MCKAEVNASFGAAGLLPPLTSITIYSGRAQAPHLTLLRLFYALGLATTAKLLKYGPCPPERDWGSRVSGLAKCLIASLCVHPSISPPTCLLVSVPPEKSHSLTVFGHGEIVY